MPQAGVRAVRCDGVSVTVGRKELTAPRHLHIIAHRGACRKAPGMRHDGLSAPESHGELSRIARPQDGCQGEQRRRP